MEKFRSCDIYSQAVNKINRGLFVFKAVEKSAGVLY